MRGLPILLLLAAPAWAEGTPPPRCDASRDGVLACVAGRSCLCRFERGGTVTGRPTGHLWDCGPLRPDCAPAPARP